MHNYPISWDDMSDFLVHFTEGRNNQDDYMNMMGIYWDHTLKPKNPFGIGKNRCPSSESQFAICFSEIPPGQWSRLSERRETKFGIAFRKSFILSKGGGPVWYVFKNSPHWQVLQRMMDIESSNPEADVWKITPLIDAPGEYGSAIYFFEWEREWRHIGEFCFNPDDVEFLLIPEELHQAARNFFEKELNDNSGPAYLCPYVDPCWDKERILKTLNSI